MHDRGAKVTYHWSKSYALLQVGGMYRFNRWPGSEVVAGLVIRLVSGLVVGLVLGVVDAVVVCEDVAVVVGDDVAVVVGVLGPVVCGGRGHSSASIEIVRNFQM